MYADFRVGLPVALACTWYGSPFGLVGYSPSYVSLPSHPPPWPCHAPCWGLRHCLLHAQLAQIAIQLMPLLLLRASLLVCHWPSIMRGPYCAALLIVQALGVCICAPRCCTVIWGVRQFLGLSCRLHSCLLPPYSAVCVRASTSGLLPGYSGWYRM